MKRFFLPLLLLVSVAVAVTYRVDTTGGPESLADEVATAFSAWLELDDSLSADVDESANTRFAYAQDALLGPDTVSLSLRRQNPDEVDVLLDPNSSSRPSALLHETGLLLGLGVRSEGVMNPALGETPLSLGEEEAATLLDELSALDEDLNFDGVVDFYDLTELAKGFGQRGVSLPADIDDNGVVDNADVERLRAAYTFSAPSPTPPGEEEELLTDEDDFGEDEADDIGEDEAASEDSPGESGAGDEADPTEPSGDESADDPAETTDDHSEATDAADQTEPDDPGENDSPEDPSDGSGTGETDNPEEPEGDTPGETGEDDQPQTDPPADDP